MTLLDLFDAPVVTGLSMRPGIIDTVEEAGLIARIDATGLSPFRFQQWTGKRMTRSYGWSCNFETGRFAAAEPIPDWLASIKERAAAFAGMAPDALSQALLIRYDPGAGIGRVDRFEPTPHRAVLRARTAMQLGALAVA